MKNSRHGISISEIRYKIIPTSHFLMTGKCGECQTTITRYNSELSDDGIRTCKVCGHSQINGWRVPMNKLQMVKSVE